MSARNQTVRLIRKIARMTALLALIIWVFASPLLSETWMGLEVEPENRCSAYNRSRDYRYSQSLEPAIAARMGGIRCRYNRQTLPKPPADRHRARGGLERGA